MGPFTTGTVSISGEGRGSALVVDVRGKLDEEYVVGAKADSRASESEI